MTKKIRTTVEVIDNVAWITMDDGKVNVMSKEMLEELAARLDALKDDCDVLVLTGREGIFSAGFDMKTINKGMSATVPMVEAGIDLIEKMLAYPRPIITACTGHAFPMGAFLMLSADVRYGVSGDWKIGMNEVAIGISVPYFALELAKHRLAPPSLTHILSGGMVGPDLAVALGYLDIVVEPEVLKKRVRAEAERLKSVDMPSFETTKQRVNEPVLAAIRKARAKQYPVEFAA